MKKLLFQLIVVFSLFVSFGVAQDQKSNGENSPDFIPQVAGDLDLTFNGTGKVRTGFGFGTDAVRAVAVQSNGKIVAAGTAQDGFADNFAVARYKSDGSLDPSFDNDGKVTTAVGSSIAFVTSLAIQNDGKILVAGSSAINSKFNFTVVRYNENGSLDTTFDTDGIVRTAIGSNGSLANSIIIKSDGKIVVVGITFPGAESVFAAVRYNIDGSLDTTFDNDGIVITAIGSSNDQAVSAAIQTDDKIVVAGYSKVGSSDDFAVVRYNIDGSLDSTFSSDGKLTTPIGAGDDNATSVAIQPNGQIIVAGHSLTASTRDFAIVRYNTDGNLDTTFDSDGKVTTAVGSGDDFANSVVIQSDGKIVAAGSSFNGESDDIAIVRYDSTGETDVTFDGDGKFTTAVGAGDNDAYSVAVQSDGKIVAGGVSIVVSSEFTVLRCNPNGSLDVPFGINGGVQTDIGSDTNPAFSVAVQTDGKIVTAGYVLGEFTYDFALTRHNPNGTLDTAFGNDGKVVTDFGASDDIASAVAIQSDGKILVAGYTFDGFDLNFALARYNPDGNLDPTFDSDGLVSTIGLSEDKATSIVIQADGKIVLAGYSKVGAYNDFTIVRYNENGSLDPTFDGDGKTTTAVGSFDDIVNSVAVQPDGKIVAAGYSDGSANTFTVVRYNENGSLDATFDGDGKLTTSFGSLYDEAQSVAVQTDGKIIVAGKTYIANYDFAVVRYNSNGSLDNSFDNDGKVITQIGASSSDLAYSIAIQPNGKILVAGSSSNSSNVDFAVVRYNSDGSLDNNFWSNDSLKLFGNGGKVTVDFGGDDFAYDIALQPDGKIVLAGEALGLFGVARLQNDLTPPAATATISGRVITQSGRGISLARLNLLNTQTNATFNVFTNPVGYFRIFNLPTGNSYVLTVNSKRYRFAQNQQSFQLLENIEGITFVGNIP